jgi:hypothetical protein
MVFPVLKPEGDNFATVWNGQTWKMGGTPTIRIENSIY